MNFVFLVEEPDYYEGYFYKVTVNSPGPMRFYVGSKKGKLDRTYTGSAETNKEKYNQDIAQYGAIMEILNCGDYANMIYLEKKMLKEVDARNNPEYYNDSIVTGHLKSEYNSDLVDEILEHLKAKLYPIYTHEKQFVVEMEAFQIRHLLHYPAHIANIKDQLDNTEGKWLDDKDPIVALSDYFGPEEHYQIGGNHTTEGARRSRFVKYLDVQYVPKDKWSKLDTIDIAELAALLNPQIEDVRLPQSSEEEIDWIVEQYFKRGIQPDSIFIFERLLKRKWTPRKIQRGLVPKAQEAIAKKELISSNELIIDWTSKARKKKIETKIQAANVHGIHAIARSSGYLRGLGDDILEIMLEWWESGWDKGLYIKVFVFHPTVKDKKKFENELQADFNQRFEMLTDMTKDVKGKSRLEISFEVLSFTQPAPIQESA